MAGGSAKKTAVQNTNAIRNLRIGLLVTCLSTLTLRFIIFRRPYDIVQYFLIALPFIPSFAIYNYLAKLGNPVRDGAGALLSPGSDLNQGGITEWCFDILYITCTPIRFSLLTQLNQHIVLSQGLVRSEVLY
jgi:hypothetical protein